MCLGQISLCALLPFTPLLAPPSYSITNKITHTKTQTHYEVVVVNEEEERCRDAIYQDAAGSMVPRAVHLSGVNFSRGRNNTKIASRYVLRRCVCMVLAVVMFAQTHMQVLLEGCCLDLSSTEQKQQPAGLTAHVAPTTAPVPQGPTHWCQL